jgi:hypothetical protein
VAVALTDGLDKLTASRSAADVRSMLNALLHTLNSAAISQGVEPVVVANSTLAKGNLTIAARAQEGVGHRAAGAWGGHPARTGPRRGDRGWTRRAQPGRTRRSQMLRNSWFVISMKNDWKVILPFERGKEKRKQRNQPNLQVGANIICYIPEGVRHRCQDKYQN